ncbi:MAG: phosphomannomutase CpsG [Fimbriimonas sp.]|nr:phosphomannomutase CpsG [Fimbriimonas sp.]
MDDFKVPADFKTGSLIKAFKEYDVRGSVPDILNTDNAYRIGRAYANTIRPKTVCIGHDIRLSGPELLDAFARGLNDEGVDVVDLGLIGTEMVYFATAFYGYDGGVMITASHNPKNDNGFKMVRSESRPISADTGLNEIEIRAHEGGFQDAEIKGNRTKRDVYNDFIQHLLRIVLPTELKPLKVLCDAGNGASGVALEKLLPHLPLQVTRRLFEPDGNFPNGVPNPIEEDRRQGTLKALADDKHDFGVAWDGDYDRCFFYDEFGNFIEGYYIVGILAQAILRDKPGEAIVYDPRLIWNTIEIVEGLGGIPVQCKSGHAFIKEKMRSVNAIYGGEMSAHHYFKQHWYCDSGMIPFLLIAKLVSQSGKTLGELVTEMIGRYPCSGEKNTSVANPDEAKKILAKVKAHFEALGLVPDLTDGISFDFGDWRFNLRASNTEGKVRLNVETRGNRMLMEEKRDEILRLILA